MDAKDKMKIFTHIKAAVRRYLCRDLIVPVKAVLRPLIKTFFLDRKGDGRTDVVALSSRAVVANISGFSPNISSRLYPNNFSNELFAEIILKLEFVTSIGILRWE